VVACLVGVSALCASTAFAAKKDAGAWLLEPVGARATAVQAYTPLADDASSISLNPAGLGKMEAVEILFYTREGALGVHDNYLGATWPKLGPGTLGVSWRNAGANDSDDAPFIYTNAEGKDIGVGQYSGNALTVAYGARVNDTMQVGGGLGFALDSFAGLDNTPMSDDAKSSGFTGLTIGVTGKVPDMLKYGVALRNLAGKLGTDSSIPAVLAAGVAVAMPGKRDVTVAVELEKRFVDLDESTTTVRMGAEYKLQPMALRLGTSQSADRHQWFAGFGIGVSGVQASYTFQFINSAAHGLGDAPRHYVSLSYIY
jgi:hypothetical protein